MNSVENNSIQNFWIL